MRRSSLAAIALVGLLAAVALFFLLQGRGSAFTVIAEIGVLTEHNYDRLVPQGKEVDAIYGDYLLRNDRLVAVIGNPVPRRDANSVVQDVGGAVIDLTVRDHPGDLLGAFYPGGGHFLCDDPQMAAAGKAGDEIPRGEAGMLKGMEVRFTCASPARPSTAQARLAYSLKAGEPFLTVTTEMTNTSSQPIDILLEDALRAEGPSFERTPDGDTPLAWAYDRWFGQAYGVAGDGIEARVVNQGQTTLVRWLADGESHLSLQPGQSFTLTRRLFPAADLVGVRAIEARLRGNQAKRVILEVTDPARHPVVGADVVLSGAGVYYARTRTPSDGKAKLDLPPGPYHAEVSSLGMGSRALDLDADRDQTVRVALDAGSRLVGRITDARGAPIPSKIIITGLEGTPTPDFGPEDGAEEVKNLIYTPDGTFTRVLPPGLYEVIASHGPEFDIATRRVEIPSGGARIRFDASLARSVQTPGWVSADFHGHTTASGDTVASRRGRVLNLACEQIEFAPSTEHNRLDSYDEEIKALGLSRVIKSCTGLELTGKPFLVNHQNAFPLTLRPHTQDNGAPEPDPDPARQIQRLALWEDSSEKLVQQNHPDIGWIRYDKDGDGVPDGGFAGMFPYQEAMEVWGDDILKLLQYTYSQAPDPATGQTVWVRNNNLVFNWLQLLNQGVRMPAVINTDAHTNFHGSGGRRNYVRCFTDDPARIDPLEIVRQAEKGHVIVTNGPYLEVSLAAVEDAGAGAATIAIPGDEIVVPGGHVLLKVRVQCPNWFDIDRVQFLLNGRVAEDLGRTRYNNPREFDDGPVKFEKEIDIFLKTDTHIIVVAWHKKKPLAAVMGPGWGDFHPTAISNPIYVDVDGNGFVANGDTLGHPLPVKGGQIVPGPPPPPPAQTAPASPPN